MNTIVFSDNSLWGCINFRGSIIKHFIDNGYRVVVIAPEDKNLEAGKLPKGVILEPITMQRAGNNPFNDWKYARTLSKLYKKYNPILVFHYTIKPNIFGTFAATHCGIPSVTFVTGLGYVFANHGLTAKIGRLLYKIALKQASKALILNSDNCSLLINKGYVAKEKAILLTGGEGVDLQKFNVLPKHNNAKTVFLMVARVLYDKGYLEFVEAARANPNAEFRLVGAVDSNPQSVPIEVIENEKSIKYLGFIGKDAVKEQIQQADCIVLPSYHEGLSGVLMEALACGRPIITTDIAGCRETVDADVNGYLVPKKDAKALIEACDKFINLSIAKKQTMSEASRKKAEKEFDIKIVIEVYTAIVDEFVKKTSSK